MRKRVLLLIVLGGMLISSCLLPGMIPMDSESEVPLPVMEENTDTVLEVLRGGDWHLLQSLAEEQYTDEDYARPGTLPYTVTVTDTLPVYFSYGWCAVDQDTLVQNIENMSVRLSINEEALGENVIHSLSFTSPTNLVCVDFGVLITEWQAGEYELEAVVTFEEPINDGLADFEAGDYIFIYNVTVSEDREGTSTPSSTPDLIHEPVLQKGPDRFERIL
jgi:hypothetical protein